MNSNLYVNNPYQSNLQENKNSKLFNPNSLPYTPSNNCSGNKENNTQKTMFVWQRFNPCNDISNTPRNDLQKNKNSKSLNPNSLPYTPSNSYSGNKENNTQKTMFVWQPFYSSPVLLPPPKKHSEQQIQNRKKNF